jgi:LPXTG-motif cell wall-anchored protein
VERGVERNADQDAERNAGPDLAPNGGPPAGGGALAQSRDVDPPGDAPVAGLVAAGLVAVGGAAYFRLRRRRSDGAA